MKGSIKKKRKKMFEKQQAQPKTNFNKSKQDKEREILEKYSPILEKYNSLQLTSLKNKFAEEAPFL